MSEKNKEFVLCVSNSYEKKYYFNPAFNRIPDEIKSELQVMCVLFTEDVGGSLILFFDEDGELLIRTECDENDIAYDEIGAGLLVNRMQREKSELFGKLELFYRVVFLGATVD